MEMHTQSWLGVVVKGHRSVACFARMGDVSCVALFNNLHILMLLRRRWWRAFAHACGTKAFLRSRSHRDPPRPICMRRHSFCYPDQPAAVFNLRHIILYVNIKKLCVAAVWVFGRGGRAPDCGSVVRHVLQHAMSFISSASLLLPSLSIICVYKW
jgi:hypothetical protein